MVEILPCIGVHSLAVAPMVATVADHVTDQPAAQSVALGPGALTRTDSDVGIFSMPVIAASGLFWLGWTRARFTQSTRLVTSMLMGSRLRRHPWPAITSVSAPDEP